MSACWRRACALLVLLLWPLMAQSVTAQKAQIRVQANAASPLWVGQQISLSVTLLAPGYFASAASFDLPDPAGVLLMPPQEHPVVGSETIDGVMYTTQLHALQAWPMRAGEQQIPALTVRFAYKPSPLDPNSISAAVTSEAIVLQVAQPPGTEAMGTVISARRLSAKEVWKPEISSASVEAGAAFTRTVTFTAPDVPGMIFPAFPAAQIEGLGIYSKPQVRDHNDQRGGFVGERRQEITYVAKRPGQYTIPAVEFHWFDVDQRQVRTERFAARTLDVIANPALASSGGGQGGAAAVGGTGQSLALEWLAWLALGLLALSLLLANTAVRRGARRLLSALRPVHLAPLNPGEAEPRD